MATEETELKSAVKQYLDLMGIYNFPLLQGVGSHKGLPDRIMHYQKRVHYLEIKRLKGKLSEHQLLFQEQCQRDNVPYIVIKSLDDIIEYVEALKAGE